jgi:hypothetical protein
MPQVDEPPQEHVAPSDAARDAIHKLAELRAYAQQYVSAKTDLAKHTARKIAVFAVLGLVGLVAAGAMLITALVLLLAGIAGAIGAAAGGRMWVGNLVVGFLVLGIFAGGAMAGLGILKKAWMKATVKKYELSQQQQRDAFGRSSRDRTAAAGAVEI